MITKAEVSQKTMLGSNSYVPNCLKSHSEHVLFFCPRSSPRFYTLSLILGSMQMSMRKLNSHTILQLWCCYHVMYKLLYPSIRVRTVPSGRVRVSVSFTFGVTPLRILICMCPLIWLSVSLCKPSFAPGLVWLFLIKSERRYAPAFYQ